MKMKKRIIALLLAVLLAVGLIGCKDVLKGIVHKATGTSDEVQEEDTTRWADATADPLIIQGIADSSAKFAAATADGCLYAVFNGIWSRSTGYFTAPTGSLNIMAPPRAPRNSRWHCGKKWMAAQSMCRTAPTISIPTAPTTAAPFPGWTRRHSTV